MSFDSSKERHTVKRLNKQDVIDACLFEYIVGKHMGKADDAESEESE